jgi:hypothetical protein
LILGWRSFAVGFRNHHSAEERWRAKPTPLLGSAVNNQSWPLFLFIQTLYSSRVSIPIRWAYCMLLFKFVCETKQRGIKFLASRTNFDRQIESVPPEFMPFTPMVPCLLLP